MATTTSKRTKAPLKPATPAGAKPRSAGIKKVSPPPAPVPKVVTAAAPVVAEPDLKKKELIDLVVARSGIKKKDAKPTIEAMLAVLGEAIASGRGLNLQPMGKLRINRAEEKANGRVIVCKLRQSRPADSATGPTLKQPLAATAE